MISFLCSGFSPATGSGGCSLAACGLLTAGTPPVAEDGLQGAQASGAEVQRLSKCGSQVPGYRLNSCGTQAEWLRGTWDLPRSGSSHVSCISKWILYRSGTREAHTNRHSFLKYYFPLWFIPGDWIQSRLPILNVIVSIYQTQTPSLLPPSQSLFLFFSKL